jgi:hypothetical protein
MLSAAALNSPNSACESNGPVNRPVDQQRHPWAGFREMQQTRGTRCPGLGLLCDATQHPKNQHCVSSLEPLQPERGYGQKYRNPRSGRRICRLSGFAKTFFRILAKRNSLEIG